jgi:histidinol-phosphate aminotransferase
VRQPFNVSTPAQAAALAALDDDAFLEKSRALVREELPRLYERLREMGLEALPTQANFFLIRMPVDAKVVYQAMLREGVIVRAMNAYGLPDCIRINVGTPEENGRFLRTLNKVLKDLNAPKGND